MYLKRHSIKPSQTSFLVAIKLSNNKRIIYIDPDFILQVMICIIHMLDL